MHYTVCIVYKQLLRTPTVYQFLGASSGTICSKKIDRLDGRAYMGLLPSDNGTLHH